MYKYRDKVNTFKKQILAIQELILFLVKITAVIRKECNECNSYMQQINAWWVILMNEFDEC